MNNNLLIIILMIVTLFWIFMEIRQEETKECLKTKSTEICKKEIELQFGF